MFRNTKSFYDSRMWHIIVQSIVLVLSIASVVLSTMAIITIKQSKTETDYIINNWSAKPMTSVVMVPRSEGCPDGYSLAQQHQTVWPGAEGLGCACPFAAMDSNGEHIRSTYSKCIPQQIEAGCVEDKGLGPIDLVTWRGGMLCVKRDGPPAADFINSYSSRPNPVDGTCPVGYQKCGNGDYDVDRAICFPDDKECPITFMISDGNLPKLNTSYSWSHNPFPSAGDSNTTTMFVTIEGKNIQLYGETSSIVVPKQLPMVEFIFGFEDFRLPEYGPCFAEEFNASVTYGGITTFIDKANFTALSSYNPNCVEFDSRWVPIDTYTESSVLAENFLVNDRCAGLQIGQALASDYWTSKQPCSLNVQAPLGEQCEYKFPLGRQCDPADTICESIMSQSNCGHLLHFMKPSVAIRKMALYGRQQIYWSSTCEGSEGNLKGSSNQQLRAVVASTWEMSVSSISNLILCGLAIFLIILFSGNVDLSAITGRSEDEEKFIYLTQTVIPVCACVAKLVVNIVCIIIFSRAVQLFAMMGKGECSDDLTEQSIKETGQEFPIALTEMVGAFMVNLIQIIVVLSNIKRKNAATKSKNTYRDIDETTPLQAGNSGILRF